MTARPFTLLELLVAMLVSAIVIPVATRALLLSGRLAERATTAAETARLADDKLQELVVTGAWRDAATAGDFGDDFPGYTWELTTDGWTSGTVTMRRLDLTVASPARPGAATVTLSTLVPETTTP